VPNDRDRRRTRPIRVLLADDHPLFVETLTLVLGSDDRIEVVGRAADGVEAVELGLELRPDVVLMDVHMPRCDGIEATRTLRAGLPGVRVVMLSSFSTTEDLDHARDAGAFAYLTKDADGPTIAGEIVRASTARLPRAARRAA
jgi:DNA-binding NarL/FixJ family response regulator